MQAGCHRKLRPSDMHVQHGYCTATPGAAMSPDHPAGLPAVLWAGWQHPCSAKAAIMRAVPAMLPVYVEMTLR